MREEKIMGNGREKKKKTGNSCEGGERHWIFRKDFADFFISEAFERKELKVSFKPQHYSFPLVFLKLHIQHRNKH